MSFDVKHVSKLYPVCVAVLCLRSRAGPLLLGIIENAEDQKAELKDSRPWRSLPLHRDEDQVRLDVDRSFIYYPDSESSIPGVSRLGD
jgi:hypothetical protein